MRSWILCFVAIFIATACHRTSATPEELEKQELANLVRHKAAAKIKEETNLCPVGTIGQMLNKVQVLGLSFYYYQTVDIAEGRKLLIKAINSIMEEVNTESRIHPFLSRLPFTPRNVEIIIFLRTPEGRSVNPGALWSIEASEGYLRYDIDDPTTKKLTTIYKETYDEAIARLNNPTLPLASFQPDNKQISEEELAKLRKGVSLVADDGSIWHLDEKGMWAKDPK